ncbi:MAG: hypothetical protein J6Y17_02530 [Elusimicrobiaceae bacterium]|nr:hypothetical protein [Elusimicrobiaceae bacterium]
MHKILGYLLICIGLFIILFALHAMYQVFINGGSVANIINFADLTFQTQVGPLQFPMQQTSLIANLGLFALFMGFLVAVGGKVASIGCQILKIERLRETLLQLKPENITEQTLKSL